MATKKKVSKRKAVARKTKKNKTTRRWPQLSLLLVLLLALAPVAEREALIAAHNYPQLTELARAAAYKHAQLVSSAQSPLSFWLYRLSGDWGRDLLLSGRYAEAIQSHELKHIEQLLEVDDYTHAREYVLASISGREDRQIFRALQQYERDNFSDLKKKYLRVNFDWSYEAYRLNMPEYMRNYLDREFFSNFIDYQELRLRRYPPASYDGVFLALKVSNDFLALSPTGVISFEAEGKSDIKGTLKSIADTAMSGISGIVSKGIDVAVDVWNGTEPPRVQQLQAKPQTSIWHVGKAFKPSKGFEVDPGILEQNWSVE